MSSPRCDIVIPSRNRPEPLRRCFAALRDQTEKDFGVIVVDDGSEPALATVLGEADCQDLHVTFRANPVSLGPGAARNAGVAASEAEFVIFLDDDIRPNPTFVEAHLNAVKPDGDSAHPIVSFGPFVEPDDWQPNAWSQWEALQTTKEADRLASGMLHASWRHFHTGNNCLPRRVFEQIGGFNPAFKRAEDDEFGARLNALGCRFVYAPEAKAFHYPNRSLQSWLDLPRSYTYYEQVIDTLYPSLQYASSKRRELSNRARPVRIVRRLLGGGRVRTRLAVTGAVSVARVAHHLGVHRIAMGALSVAWDAEVHRTYRTTIVTAAELDAIRAAQRSALNDEVEPHHRA